MAAVFANAAGTIATIFISLYLATKLHFGIAQIGTIMTGFGVGSFICSYLGGFLSDHLSPLKISITVLCINAITWLFLPLTNSFIWLLVITTIMGGANAAFAPAIRTALMSLCERTDQARVSGLRYTMANMGAGAGVFIDGLIAMKSYFLLFLANSLAIFAAAGLLILFLNKGYAKGLPQPQQKPQEHFDQSIFHDSVLMILLAALLLIGLVFAQLKTSYPIYLHHNYGVSPLEFSYLFLLSTLLIVAVQMPLLTYLHKFNANYTAGVGALFLGLGFALLPLSVSYSMAIFSCVLWTLGEILFFSTVQVLVYERAKEHNRGHYMGVYQAVYTFALMLGPIGGSTVYGYLHGDILWYGCGALGVIALAFCYYCGMKLENKK